MHSSFEHIPKTGLSFLRECPLCGRQNQDSQMSVLKKQGSVQLMYMTCEHCGSAVMALVTVTELGMSSIGLYTDLTFEDAKAMLAKEPISDDDVIAFHELLTSESKHVLKTIIQEEQSRSLAVKK